MCHIITHTLEFNNWRAFKEIYEYIGECYSDCYPYFQIEVPWSLRGCVGWDWLESVYIRLMKIAPDDLEEMSIYGKIWFDVTRDYTRTRQERETLKMMVGSKV